MRGGKVVSCKHCSFYPTFDFVIRHIFIDRSNERFIDSLIIKTGPYLLSKYYIKCSILVQSGGVGKANQGYVTSTFKECRMAVLTSYKTGAGERKEGKLYYLFTIWRLGAARGVWGNGGPPGLLAHLVARWFCYKVVQSVGYPTTNYNLLLMLLQSTETIKLDWKVPIISLYYPVLMEITIKRLINNNI